jgi:hypothetical protein
VVKKEGEIVPQQKINIATIIPNNLPKAFDRKAVSDTRNTVAIDISSSAGETLNTGKSISSSNYL